MSTTSSVAIPGQSLMFMNALLLSPVGERCIAISLSVCLSVREHISGTAEPIFTKFLCRSHVAVARSSSGGVAICYVLPVLWVTPRLAVVGRCDNGAESDVNKCLVVSCEIFS